MSGDAHIPSVRFDTGRFEQSLELDVLREFVRGVWQVEPAAGTTRPVTTFGQSWLLGEIVATDFEHGTFVQIGRNGLASQGKVQVRLYRRGRCFALFGDEIRILRPDAVHLFDSDFEGHYHERCAVCMLAIPSELIGYDPSRHGRHLAFPTDRPIGRVLANTMTELCHGLTAVTRAESAALEAMLVGLFRGVLAGSASDEPARESVSAARASAMRAYLAGHLGQTDIGVDTLRRKFGISRATVFRAFEAEGGVDRFIANRRLDGALRDLTSEPYTYGRIQRVAQRWNFHDLSHFNRAFRRRYGFSPSEVPVRHTVLSTPGHDQIDVGNRMPARRLSSIYR